ncbi:hypothetical protein BJ165DRAFT_1383751 [Panaeolus papilionaceus]|nr:hypothetical protein BJ165DRAFT_1383751 [Panaeolus papilionaceus]
MVLSKRNQDGEFVEWRNPQSGSSNRAATYATQIPTMEEPPTKRARMTSRSDHEFMTNTPTTPKKPAAKKPRAVRAKRGQAVPDTADRLAEPGPSSSVVLPPIAGPSQPAKSPAKRGRKKAAEVNDSNTQLQPEEKRQARFKPHPPQNILERLARVRTQRMFMIDRSRNDGELREEFSVLGSTGNVYTITIDHVPRCNCVYFFVTESGVFEHALVLGPDAAKGNHCKHIIFVFFKVLQVRESSVAWYQKALLTSELEEVFRNAPLPPNSIAHPHILAAHARATGKTVPKTPTNSGPSNKRIPTEDDDCPICYDGMHRAAESSLVFCEECGNALHKECFGQWKRTAVTSGKSLTCVWCRASWIEAPAPGALGQGGATHDSYGYLNLAGVANVSPVRDTSTYYNGPRRGQRYYGW